MRPTRGYCGCPLCDGSGIEIRLVGSQLRTNVCRACYASEKEMFEQTHYMALLELQGLNGVGNWDFKVRAEQADKTFADCYVN
ncbi:MAG: hypothetical protein AAFV46_00010 [Cyanobacteria bacterium J06635_11]